MKCYNAYIMLQKIYISNKCCSFELFLFIKESWKKCIMVSTKILPVFNPDHIKKYYYYNLTILYYFYNITIFTVCSFGEHDRLFKNIKNVICAMSILFILYLYCVHYAHFLYAKYAVLCKNTQYNVLAVTFHFMCDELSKIIYDFQSLLLNSLFDWFD